MSYLNIYKENIFTKCNKRKRYLIRYPLYFTKIIIKLEDILWNNLNYTSVISFKQKVSKYTKESEL